MVNSKTNQSDGDAERDKLRLDLLQASTAYKLSPCDDTQTKNLVAALSNYVTAWHDMAFCDPGIGGCPGNSDERLDTAAAAFKTPADINVHNALREAIRHGGISGEDFPSSMRRYVFIMSGTPPADPRAACHAASKVTFIWPQATTASSKPVPIVNAATLQGQDPWMVNERYNAHSRDRVRKATLETLDQPWASYCTTDGHEHLIRGINYYYEQRDAQAWSYGHTYGETARRFSIKTWTTPDDSRIERLMSEITAGYFSLSPYAREARAAQVSGVCVSTNPCRE